MKIIALILLLIFGADDMDATFQTRLREGKIPKRVIKITFPKQRDIFFPVDESLVFPKLFPLVFYKIPTRFDNITKVLLAVDQNSWQKFDVGTYWYVAFPHRYSGIKFVLESGNADASVMSAEYYNAAWTALTITDTTSVGGKTLNQDGTISWPIPKDWIENDVNGGTYFWVRLFVNNNAGIAVDQIVCAKASYNYKIYNDMIASVGRTHKNFNLNPENYGPTVGNFNFSFHNKPEILELLYHENWKSVRMQLIRYFTDYVTKQSEFASIENIDYEISYDFANTEQNTQDVFFPGIIKEHPRVSDNTIPVSCESMQSYWLRLTFPKYRVNILDWKRSPKTNLGAAGQIIIGSNTIEKKLLKVDQGAEAVFSADYSDTELNFTFNDLTDWDRAQSGSKIITVGREKILWDTIVGNDMVALTRGYSGTRVGTIAEGNKAIEYRPQETWLVCSRTIDTGQTFDLVAINPDDERERFIVPTNWFETQYNQTFGDFILTIIKTRLPLLGYYPSTVEKNKIIRTSQEEPFHPDQDIEPTPTVTTVNGDVVHIANNTPTDRHTRTLPNQANGTQILNADGWSNVDAIFDPSGTVAQFQGRTRDSPPYYTLKIQHQGSTIFGYSGAITADICRARIIIEVRTDDNPPSNFLFWYRGSIIPPFVDEPQALQIMGSAFNIANLYDAYGPYQIGDWNSWFDVDNWDDFQNVVAIYIASTTSANMLNTGGGSWSTARTKLQHIYWEIEYSTQMWDEADLAQVTGGNPANENHASGIWPDQLYQQQVEFNADLGALPAGTIEMIGTQKLHISFKCPDLSFTGEYFTITWGNAQSAHGSININLGSSIAQGGHNSTPGNIVDVDIDVPFNQSDWTDCPLYVYANLFSTTTIYLYDIYLSVNYLVNSNLALWTDDEVFVLGYFCGSLQHDGNRSYAWSKYSNQYDGVLRAKVSPRELSFGLITRVSIKITSQLAKFNVANQEGGCMHYQELAGSLLTEPTPAAWCWYGHIGNRNQTYTEVDGACSVNTKVFTSANATFIAWGVKPGYIFRYVTLDDNQGYYVILSIDSETQFTIDENKTREWDINKQAWDGFAANASSVSYTIHRPEILDQTGEIITQLFNITTQYTDWDSDNDFNDYIYIRVHPFTDAKEADPDHTGNEPYYDVDTNKSLARLWQPQMDVEYNDGRVSRMVVEGISGINSGDENPVSVFKNLAQGEAGIDSAFFDSDSFTTVIASKAALTDAKIDWGLNYRLNFKQFIHKMSFYFNWHPQFLERITAVDGSNPKVLDGTVITDSEGVLAYGEDTQWQPHDFITDGQAADSDANTEGNSTAGWASITGGTVSSEADPLTGSTGSYSIKDISAGSDEHLVYTLTAIRRLEDILITLKIKASTSMEIHIGVLGDSLIMDTGTIEADPYTVGTTSKRIKIIAKKDPTKTIAGVSIYAVGINAADYFQVDDLKIQRQKQTAETVQRQILISNPVIIRNMGTIGKWGPLFTEATILYALRNNGNSFSTITSQGDSYYTQLQDDVGVIPFPEKLSKLDMISDKGTAERFFGWLQRFHSERFDIQGMDLANFGQQLELGTVVFLGQITKFPQFFGREKDVLLYAQILAVDSDGIISGIVVNENFGDTLI